MKHNSMENLTENPLKEINIKQTCVCGKIGKSKGEIVKDIITEVKVGGELVLYSKMGLASYEKSYIKKALNLLLLGNKKNRNKIMIL